MKYNFDGISPKIGENVFIADNAAVIGNVEIGSDSSVWFGAVLRGDEGKITIGHSTNIQDNATMHANTKTGNGVTIGHNAIVHGCEIGDNVLIGMGATVLDGAIIGEDSIVGAGALVTGKKVFPPRSLIIGSPALLKRELTETEVESIRHNAEEYVNLKNKYTK
ncbi:MAG: gamma carbonic anhydrase family protein [Oscillospiraceae bacterium]|nr:gamma carbonic anhydrase family protein [Oscillospiraceae bacterium]